MSFFIFRYTVYINKPVKNLPIDRFFEYRDNFNYNELFYSDYEKMNKPMLEIEGSLNDKINEEQIIS